jgi:hypothetical protein
MRYIYILLLSILGSNFCWSQNTSLYREQFVTGNKLLAKQDYAGALDNFMNAYNVDSSSSNLSYKIGFCLYNIRGKEGDALKYFQKAAKKVSKQCDANSAAEKAAPPLACYYLGVLYQRKYMFAEAINALKLLKTYLTPADADYPANADRIIAQCNNAKMFIMAPTNAKIIAVGDNVNSAYSDFSPLLLQDETIMIFASRRPIGKSDVVMPDGEYHAHIFISNLRKDTTWSVAQMCDTNLNLMTDNKCSSVSLDGQEMLLYGGSDKESGLYVSRMGESHWELPERLGSDINTVGEQSNACLSPDGNTLYFVSDRPGGMGGTDIWRCVKLPNGNWSRALNAGKAINTPYDEETPFMHADGHTFFFSSQGHNSMGGYDIFFSQVLDSGKFSEPFNLGYPINTPDDEIHFSLSLDGKKGYYNSSRIGGKGKQDIYKVIMPHATERPLTVIRGQVLAAPGESLSDDVHIIATDSATNQEVGDFKPIKVSGKFTIIVPPGRTYTLSYLDDDKEFYKEVINVPAEAGYKEIHKALTLSPHPVKGTVNDTTPSPH